MNRFKNFTKPLMWFMALLLVGLVAGCGGGGGTTPPPKPAPTTPGAGTGAGGLGHGPLPVLMGSVIGAGTPANPNYVILAKTLISTTGVTAITGDLGISPAAATFITGFSLTAGATACYTQSIYVTGNIFAANYNTGTCTTPALLTTAVGDMQTAYTDAAGRPADFTEIGAGNIGGMTLPPGTYKWGSGVLIPTDVTLSGTANDTWIFQIAGGLTQASAKTVHLTGGAVAKNVFWQVADVVSIGTTAHMEGVILAQTQITLKTGATANSRLLAQSAVTLQANTVTVP
jgi:Ice-binding-like